MRRDETFFEAKEDEENYFLKQDKKRLKIEKTFIFYFLGFVREDDNFLHFFHSK